MLKLSLLDMSIRLSLALVIGGVVGFEREKKNRPAGIRTHILVCLSACLLGLVQQSISLEALDIVHHYKELAGVVKFDQARLVCQVVSGIGFLGAGTIIVSKHQVLGLTTAASLWASAAEGIAIGMGYYQVAILGIIFIMISLLAVKKVIVVPKIRNLEIQYIHRVATKEFLNQYFERNGIYIDDVTFDLSIRNGQKIYKNTYTINLPKHMTYTEVIEDISMFSNVQKIRLVTIAD
ncbi:MgtC/SapB family protein [Atopobacter sp. AH10]|uniref:MgtC/SapB family protein n=1 Tax=Atopobacter sp. AH10 TaxID=2315861 RepID=UPI000EF1B131|nr:MgtC/SapB family protein [Atopobacter sp. AH10]RLK63512.1 MgtC/SapB family protein [Atopobacter sp. AH10]